MSGPGRAAQIRARPGTLLAGRCCPTIPAMDVAWRLAFGEIRYLEQVILPDSIVMSAKHEAT